jgi:hypothetical protein
VPDDNPVDALDIEDQGQQQVNDNLSEQVDANDDATENENLQHSLNLKIQLIFFEPRRSAPFPCTARKYGGCWDRTQVAPLTLEHVCQTS